MNEFTVRIKKGFLLLICLASSVIVKAQFPPTYQLYITNEVMLSTTEYQFDICLLRTGTTPLELAAVQFGLGFDITTLNGGTLTESIVPGFSDLPVGQQPPNPIATAFGAATYNVGGIVYRYYNIAAHTPPGAGNGFIISNNNPGCNYPGTRIGRFKLTNSVAFTSSSHFNHVFSTAVGSGKTNTTVNAYYDDGLGGGYISHNITNTANHLGFNSTPTCDQNIIVNGCTPPTLTTSQVNISCVPNNPTGSATVNTSGGTSPFTYLWNDGAAQTAATATGLSAGTYTVTVTATGGCTVSTSVTITGNTIPPTVNCTGTNFCTTNPNSGSVNVAASGGTPPYTYLWSNTTTGSVNLSSSKDNAIFEQNQNNSNGAGEYIYTGKLVNGFKSRALLKFDLSSIPAGAVITGATLTLNCSMTHGGASTYDLYKITQDWGEGTSNAGSPGGQGAAATTNDATWLDRFFGVNAWTSAGGDFSGTSSASQTVNALGSYSWSGSGMVTDLQTWLNNPSNNFGWIIKGLETTNGQAKRFDTKENVTPANHPVLAVTYTIGTSSSQGGLGTGTYCVTVTGANGCTASCCYTVTSSDPILIDAGQDQSACVGETITLGGTITNATSGTWSGGNGNYPQGTAWDPGVTEYETVAADAPSVTLTLTSSNICGSASDNIIITVNPLPTITATTSISVCQGATSFSIPYSATTGSPDHYVLNPGSSVYPNFVQVQGGLSPAPSSIAVSIDGSASPGIYFFELSVDNTSTGCIQNGVTTIALTVLANPTAGITPSSGTITCSTTSILLTASGGGTYLWDNSSTNATRTVSAAGTYTVTVTAPNGCTATATAVIGSNITPPSAAITPSSGTITCTTTSILLTASGGGTYLWDDNSTSATRTVSAAGTYTVTVTDATNGCTASAQATIGSNTTPPPAAITPPSGTLTCTVTSINLLASGGGTYLWDNGSTNAGRSVSAAGTYTVTVTDPSNGCTASAQAIIGSNITPPTAAIIPSSGTITCTVTNINLVASGGGTYLWDNGSTNASRTVSAAGTYTVTVTDGTNGCTASAQATIGSNTTPPSAAITPSSGTITCTVTSINLVASGGGTYLWNNGSTNASRTVSAAGTYTVTVTDPANGCTASAQAIISSNITPPAAAASASPAAICAGGSSTLTATGGGTYLWDNGSTNASRTVSATGTYTVTVTGANGCSATATVTVTPGANPIILSAMKTDASFGGPTGTAGVTYSPSGCTIAWSPGSETTSYIEKKPAGTYTATVTHPGSGCTKVRSVTIN